MEECWHFVIISFGYYNADIVANILPANILCQDSMEHRLHAILGFGGRREETEAIFLDWLLRICRIDPEPFQNVVIGFLDRIDKDRRTIGRSHWNRKVADCAFVAWSESFRGKPLVGNISSV